MGCKRIYSAHVCLPKPRLLRRRREELHEHHRHTILLAFSTLLLIQLRRRESTYHRHGIHVTQRANGPYFSPNKLSLLASRKKGRSFFANRDKGRHRTWGPKIPLENMAERGKGGEGTRKRGRKEDVLGASSYGAPTLANSPFLEGEEKTAPDNYSITFPSSSSPSGWELNPR